MIDQPKPVTEILANLKNQLRPRSFDQQIEAEAVAKAREYVRGNGIDSGRVLSRGECNFIQTACGKKWPTGPAKFVQAVRDLLTTLGAEKEYVRTKAAETLTFLSASGRLDRADDVLAATVSGDDRLDISACRTLLQMDSSNVADTRIGAGEDRSSAQKGDGFAELADRGSGGDDVDSGGQECPVRAVPVDDQN